MKSLFGSIGSIGFGLLAVLAMAYFKDRDIESLQKGNQVLYELSGWQREQMQDLISMAEVDNAPNYIITHHPKAGEPWIVEKYWRQSEIWVALQSYNSREAAGDVKNRLESGQVKVRDLFQ